MKEYSRVIGNKTIKAIADETLSIFVESMLKAFDDIDVDSIVDGYKIQFGWSIFTLLEEGSDFYVVAPDFSSNPFEEYDKNISLSLAILRSQISFTQSMSIEGEVTSFQDKIIVGRGVLEEEKIYLERREKAFDNDSGWYIGPQEGEVSEDELEVIHAYSLIDERPELIQVLNLPIGYMAILDGETIQAIVNADNEKVWDRVTL